MSKNIYQKIERGEVSICQTCIHRLVCRAIDNQPCTECNHYQNVADVAPVRHGRWLPQIVLGEKAWDCSECKTLGSPHWKWCPMCGCRMDGEEDEHEAN